MFIPNNLEPVFDSVKGQKKKIVGFPSQPILIEKTSRAFERKAEKIGREVEIEPDVKISAELQFQFDLESDGELKIGGQASPERFDSTFYRWTNNAGAEYWCPLREEEMLSKGLGWLRENEPSKYDKSKATSLIETSRSGLLMNERCSLPRGDASSVVISVRGAYLHINKTTGVITAKKPDPKVGLTYGVPADFDWSRVDSQGVFVPRPIATDSALAGYLDTFMPDLEVRGLLQEAIASTILPITLELAFVLYGDGANGKSTLLHLLSAIHPGNRCVAMSLPSLAGEFGLQDFQTATVAIASEAPKYWSSELTDRLKAIISRDPMPLDRKFKDRITFIPRATLFLVINTLVSTTDHSYGWERKTKTIPFNVRMAADDPRRVADYHLRITENPAEMSQLLDWLLEGAVRIIKNGYRLSPDPQAVKDLAKQASVQSNSALAYIEEAGARHSETTYTPKSKAYGDYVDFCRSTGRKEMTDTKFWEVVRSAFPDKEIKTKQQTVAGKRERLVSIVFDGVGNSPGFYLRDADEGRASPPIKDIFTNEKLCPKGRVEAQDAESKDWNEFLKEGEAA